MFIKIFDIQDNLIGVEKIDAPVFARWQISNGLLVCCAEGEEPDGIFSADGNSVYLIDGHMPHGEKEPYAEIITEAEYEQLMAGNEIEDPEDETPEIPEGTDEQEVLTRAQLTERINFLEECLLEMSEIVYG